MKIVKRCINLTQIRALLHKDILVRRRQWWLIAIQILWPFLLFVLLYTMRLKYTSINYDNCQFPTRQLPTMHNTLPAYLTYICTLENRCSNTEDYNEYLRLEKAPLKPIVDIAQILINDDRMFETLINLSEKGNFITAIIQLVTNRQFVTIRKHIGKVIDLIPEVERLVNGSFDVKQLFSDRETFVKAGNLVCGYPFPNTETIPLLREAIESKDFSSINDDELKVMPTPYCKRLYLDITSNNYGKITWGVIKPIIHGKILYAPFTEDTASIIKYANSTFEELNRLKLLTVAVTDILTKIRNEDTFNKNFDKLIDLIATPFVRNLIGNGTDIDQIVMALKSLRTDPIVYDMVVTIKNLLECLSVDRFIPATNEHDLQHSAYNLNKQHLFFAGIYFNQTNAENIIYTMHMDIENSPPTIENRNRFWFPGPAGNMILDMKYHRGFVQIKQSIDMGIIKHKKAELIRLGTITEKPPENVTSNTNFKITIFTEDDEDNGEIDDYDNDELKSNNTYENVSDNTEMSTELSSYATTIIPTTESFEVLLESQNSTNSSLAKSRQKRQGFFDAFFGLNLSKKDTMQFAIDDLKFYTKQFPYPAYIRDDFKTGIYLAQAIQAVFFVGLLAEIASSVRHLIWMRESKNSMIMRSMGLRGNSEITAWCIITFCEYIIIFIGVSIILYGGGLLIHTTWLFTMTFLCIFACSIIAFCFMCSTFFNSATIGAVATGVLFFISFCPYIIVLMFDAKLNAFENFLVKLSFTTSFAHGWSNIMRMELQEIGLNFMTVFDQQRQHDYFIYNVSMIILDTFIYICIGYLWQKYKHYEHRFVKIQRERLDDDVGATLINVSKIYNGNKIAISNVSLTFQRNQVTCLLGRNGAGKSTILKMLTGQIEQSSGRVVISQCKDTFLNDNYFKVGVCSQDNILIPDLTAREHLELYAKIKLTHNFNIEIENTLKSLNLGKYVNYRASQLSGGYKRRLCVALAFLGSPTVVILDEPCNGVDAQARKDIWDLIERLRKGRAVIFSTHFLDEAEHLSDVLVIMKNGKIVANYNSEVLKNQCTSYHQICTKGCDARTTDEILTYAHSILQNVHRLDNGEVNDVLKLHIGYEQQFVQAKEFLKYLHQLQNEGRIKQLTVDSDNIEQIFKSIDQMHDNNHNENNMNMLKFKNENDLRITCDTKPLSRWQMMRILFWKRLKHFTRNYRIILSVLILPAIFEIFAMWFVIQRNDDEYDKSLKLSRDLYKKSIQVMSMEREREFTAQVYSNIQNECTQNMWPCKEFKNSKEAFYWLLNTLSEYREKRYGGYTFNDTETIIWYNNKGYHAMVSWLNDLNSHILQTEANDSNYQISTYNEPWKLSASEFTTSSILRNSGDAFLAFIFLTAFSLVVSVASVYLVNERVNGEKLQQRLCGVDIATYWIVAFIWDFLIIMLAITVCVIIILIFNISVFTSREQLWGLIVLSLFYGFACIPIVHVFEKFFTDSSVAIVTIFVLNIFIPLFTLSLVVVLGVVGDTPIWDNWRHFLNRAFLIFPQHALGDGFMELGKNYIIALMFSRFDVDSYKNPINSDLLLPHLISLGLLGVIFIIINVLLEGDQFLRLHDTFSNRFHSLFKTKPNHVEELKIVTIQNSLKRNVEMENEPALKVERLCKSYNGGYPVVKNVNFEVKAGECFGLLGKNGAGKSTIFRMLSGQVLPDSGKIKYRDPEISYCPQTNTVDRLLTVQECIEFYGHLRRVNNIPKLVSSLLQSFQLESYRNILVKNLSGGNRRKLTVATTCCGRTSTVLMDEPTSDMDPVMRTIVYQTIHNLLNENRAIVLTSHSISEIEGICHRIAVLRNGNIFATGTLDKLLEEYGGFYNVTIYINNSKIDDIKQEVCKRITMAKDIQCYARSIKFKVKVHEALAEKKMKSSISEEPEDITKQIDTLYLYDLFEQLNKLLEEYDDTLRYAVSCCKLDAIFERILNKNEVNGSSHQYVAFEGTSSTGYVHKGYVDTEVENETVT